MFKLQLVATPPKHREALVRAAADLFRRQGYAATGLNEILKSSGAPKGSLYHYLPGGKEQIGEEVVRVGGQLVTDTLTELADSQSDAGSLLREYARLLAGWVSDSDFHEGSPITTVLLELAPDSESVTAAGQAVYRQWTSLLRDTLIASGVGRARAERLAILAVSALEGSLVRARVERSGQPILDSLGEVADVFDGAIAAAHSH